MLPSPRWPCSFADFKARGWLCVPPPSAPGTGGYRVTGNLLHHLRTDEGDMPNNVIAKPADTWREPLLWTKHSIWNIVINRDRGEKSYYCWTLGMAFVIEKWMIRFVHLWIFPWIKWLPNAYSFSVPTWNILQWKKCFSNWESTHFTFVKSHLEK